MLKNVTVTVDSFEQGGFYVDSSHSDYNSTTEIRTQVVTPFEEAGAIRYLTVHCSPYQWSFICFKSDDTYVQISEALGYKDSGTVIDVRSYEVSKVRIELHDANGINIQDKSATIDIDYDTATTWHMEGTNPMPDGAPHIVQYGLVSPTGKLWFKVVDNELKLGTVSDKALGTKFHKPFARGMWQMTGLTPNQPYEPMMPSIMRDIPQPPPPPPPTPTVDPLEFYDEYNSEYLDGLRQKHRRFKLRVELLGYYENVIGEITKDVSLEASGQITINNEQITRRSCVLNLINVEKQYLPSPDNPIWFNRKFKLWIGIAIKDKTYWWSQGVYFTQKATSDGNVVNIQGIDKGGALDGTIKTGMLDTTYIIEANTTIANVIRDTLMWNETNSPYLRRNTRATSYPIDPITPIISSRFDTYRTQNEIALNGNDYVSTLFSSLADGYGADAYYNTNGRFVFQLMADSNRIDGYRFMAHQWDFGTFDEFYADANVEYNFDGYNVVTVYTNESDLENVSYTAANNNPLSPLRLDSAGVRRMSDVEIPYVNVSQDEMESRCKAYADYLLMKESMRGMAITFNSPIIPHLDVNRTIGVTDDRFNLNTDTFVINSITIPLSAESMQINATKISWLPDNTSIEGEN